MEKKATKKAAPVKKAATKKVSTKEPVKKTPVKKPVQAKQPAVPVKPTVETKPVAAAKKPRKKVEVEPVVQAPIVQPKKEIKEVKKVTVAVSVPEVVAVKPVPVQAPKSAIVLEPKAAPKRIVPRKGSSLIAHGVGRRKCAVARVWLRLGSGKMVINEREFLNYFPTEITQLAAGRPFDIIANAQHYDVVANVLGGGYCAQAEAVGLGFARALLQLNESWRPELRKAGLLTVDSRQKERKKYGQKRARRKFQFVKR